MKALLRSAILGLLVFGGYAAFSSAPINASMPTLPRPNPCPGIVK